MRITTSQLYDNSLKGILDSQKKLVRAQDVLIEQKNILKPSDDPAGATKVIRLEEDLARLDQFQSNGDLLQSSLENKEITLGNIHTTIQRARNLTLQAGNGAYDVTDRNAIAGELTQIKEELFDLFNSKSGQGEYIFAGSKSSSAPFVEQSDGSFVYQGDESVKKIQISETLKIDSGVPGSGFAIFEDTDARSTLTISGASTATGGYEVSQSDTFERFHDNNYVNIPPNPLGSNDYSIVLLSPSTYEVRDNGGAVLDSGSLNGENKMQFAGLEFEVNGTTGNQLDFTLDAPKKQNVLNTLNDLINKMTDVETPGPDYHAELQAAIYSFDNGMQQVSSARSELGGRINVVQSTQLANVDQEISIKEAKAKISEVDFAEAISDLQKHETALQAASQTFSKVTGLSLFNFIR